MIGPVYRHDPQTDIKQLMGARLRPLNPRDERYADALGRMSERSQAVSHATTAHSVTTRRDCDAHVGSLVRTDNWADPVLVVVSLVVVHDDDKYVGDSKSRWQLWRTTEEVE